MDMFAFEDLGIQLRSLNSNLSFVFINLRIHNKNLNEVPTKQKQKLVGKKEVQPRSTVLKFDNDLIIIARVSSPV